MTAPSVSVCSPWTTTDAIQRCSKCGDIEDVELLQQSIDAASDLLYVLSGKKFSGECEITVRPCARWRNNDWFPRYSHRWEPGWGWCFGCGGDGCGNLNEVVLGGFPVTGITEVIVDGVPVDPSLYRVDNWRTLVRLPDPDGTNPGWYQCQRMDLDTTEERTWEVTYTYGMAPPAPGVLAANELACELVLACRGDSTCALPRRVTSITRQGLTMAILDPFQFLDNGKTGLYNVDIFLATYNPTGNRGGGAVISPDIGKRVRHTNTGAAPGS